VYVTLIGVFHICGHASCIEPSAVISYCGEKERWKIVKQMQYAGIRKLYGKYFKFC
jgi:hypothetical protein